MISSEVNSAWRNSDHSRDRAWARSACWICFGVGFEVLCVELGYCVERNDGVVEETNDVAEERDADRKGDGTGSGGGGSELEDLENNLFPLLFAFFLLFVVRIVVVVITEIVSLLSTRAPGGNKSTIDERGGSSFGFLHSVGI